MSKRDLITFITLAFMWSLSFIFYRIGVPEFGSVAFASIRLELAGITMLLFVLLNPKNRQGILANWKLLTIIGLCSTAIPFVLFGYAAKSVNAGVLAVLNASVPMMSGVMASLFFNDKLSKKQILGLVIGVIGVFILMSENFLAMMHSSGSDHSSLQSQLWPMGFALFACIGYATGANLTRNYLEHISPIAITAGTLITASIVMLPVAIYNFPYHHSISAKAWGSVICIGILSTAIALIFMNQLIKSIGPVRATSITLVIPIFAIIFGYILLGESLDIFAIVGSVVILFGTYLSLNLSVKKLAEPQV